MQLPTTIRILGVPFEVALSTRILDRGVDGESNTFRQEIAILDGAPPERQGALLLHEILEVIDTELELKLRHATICALAVALYQVLSDNPGLFTGCHCEKGGDA